MLANVFETHEKELELSTDTKVLENEGGMENVEGGCHVKWNSKEDV